MQGSEFSGVVQDAGNPAPLPGMAVEGDRVDVLAGQVDELKRMIGGLVSSLAPTSTSPTSTSPTSPPPPPEPIFPPIAAPIAPQPQSFGGGMVAVPEGYTLVPISQAPVDKRPQLHAKVDQLLRDNPAAEGMGETAHQFCDQMIQQLGQDKAESFMNTLIDCQKHAAAGNMDTVRSLLSPWPGGEMIAAFLAPR
jgi:hypothetical protein